MSPETHEYTIELEGRTIVYDITGEGPSIVFVHGVWATGGVWYPVIDRLSAEFRCINIHLPLGVHRYPAPGAADHSPAALARVVAGVMDAVDARDATLVGNDTGGAICQLVAVSHAQRVGRLVLTNCDAFEVFPPRKLAPVYWLARVPALWTLFAKLLRGKRAQRRFFATVSNSEPDPATLAMLMSRFVNDAGVREDLRLTIRAISPRITLAAAKRFSQFRKNVLVLWGTQDGFFPVPLAKRLTAAFPQARLQLVEGAKLFVGLDRPEAVATAIATFAAQQQPAAHA